MQVGKQFKFDAAHHIEGHPLCGKTHGHTWTLTVTLTGVLDSKGMLIDFHRLGVLVRGYIGLIDHEDINEVFTNESMFQDLPITAETLSIWFATNLANCLKSYSNLDQVGCRVQEGEGGWAESYERIHYGQTCV